MAGWQLQGLDLRGHTDVLRRLDARGALVLGGRLDPVAEDDLRARGRPGLPAVPDVPFDPYRARLYTPEELYDGLDGDYADTLDARVYAWSRHTGHDLSALVAQSLHDAAVDDALEEWTRGRRLVGVMGGHALARGARGYADAARLGRSLARAGLTVATGGGPGAMEAANLGAYLSGHDDDALDEALDLLAAVPVLRAVRGRLGRGRRSTYDGGGRRAPSRWACRRGSTGTSRRTRSRAPSRSTSRTPSARTCCCTCAGPAWCSCPGAAAPCRRCSRTPARTTTRPTATWRRWCSWAREYWTEELPAWPLLRRLAEGRAMADHVHLVDDLDEVAGLLADPARLDG